MPQELTILGLAAVMALVHIMVAINLKTRQYGTAWNMGARDETLAPLNPVAGRLARAQANYLETLPIAVIALAVVLDRIPPEVVEASHDLGASPTATFWSVIFPLSRPGIATAALLTAVPMLGELVIPVLLGGNKGLFLSQAISTQYVQSQNYALGSAMVVLLVIAVAVIVALLVRLTRGFEGTAG